MQGISGTTDGEGRQSEIAKRAARQRLVHAARQRLVHATRERDLPLAVDKSTKGVRRHFSREQFGFHFLIVK